MKNNLPLFFLKPLLPALAAWVFAVPPGAKATECLLTDDSTVFSGSAPGTYGDSATILVDSASTKCAVIRFEIASMLPDGITADQIATATLRFYCSAAPTGTGSTSFYKILPSKSWLEGNATGVWVAGTDYDATPIISGIPVGTFALNRYVAFDITDTVKSWVTNPSSNNGLIFRPTGTIRLTFASKENTAGGHDPVLAITLRGLRIPPLGDVSMGVFTNGPQP